MTSKIMDPLLFSWNFGKQFNYFITKERVGYVVVT